MHASPSPLQACACGALPAAAAAALEQSGFVVFAGPFAAERFEEVADAYDAAVASATRADVRVGSTSTRVPDFVNRGPAFDLADTGAPAGSRHTTRLRLRAGRVSPRLQRVYVARPGH